MKRNFCKMYFEMLQREEEGKKTTRKCGMKEIEKDRKGRKKKGNNITFCLTYD